MIEYRDLSGYWDLFLDESCSGDLDFNDTMYLPDTTSCAKKGSYNNARETGFLTDEYKFEGWAWFRKKVDFNMPKCSAIRLFLERTRVTELYVDNVFAGVRDSLCAPHIYDLSEYLNTGVHELIIKVSNVDYKTKGGHMTSPDTQTNWNGIVGKIALIGYGESYAKNIKILTDTHDNTCHITSDIIGKQEGTVEVCAESFNGNKKHFVPVKSYDFKDGKIDLSFDMGEDCLYWSEFEPNLYKLKVDVNGDVSEHIIGMREFSTDGNKFTINGKKTFLRGKHDGMIFPLTGYAPCSVDEWLRVMKISKSFGINHYRFHTCCPPEAAFTAADMLGIYMEPELPFWGTVADKGEEGYNEEEQEFLISEGFRIMEAFGNHPSFCMMSMGNELWGSKERINEIMGHFKKIDKRHLYTQGSNNFQFFPNVVENDDFFTGVRLSKDRLIRGSYAMCDAPLGHIQTDKPSTKFMYDDVIELVGNSDSETDTVQIQYGTTAKTVKAEKSQSNFSPEIPIVTHEIGQYETYPDYSEIKKYIGPLKARNFEVFKERLDKAGLLSLADDYFRCSGKLAAACYKEEMESVFRSKLLGGFQILDIQDFSGQGTALVGMLDAFMDNKGIISADEWREFCNDAVLLAIFDSYTCVENDKFNAAIKLTWYRDFDYVGLLVWSIKDSDGNVISSGTSEISTDGKNYIDITEISIKMPKVNNVTDLTFSLALENTDVRNHYTITVIPNVDFTVPEGVYIFEEINCEAQELLKSGKTVLVVPDLKKLDNSIDGFYCQDFWCFPMFRSISEMMKKPIPVGTMGLLIDKDNPALKEFASHEYSTPQWWDIVMNSRPVILDNESDGKKIIIRTIDNFERNHNLSILYEYKKSNGKVVVCSCNINKLSISAEGKVFIKSLFDYVKN